MATQRTTTKRKTAPQAADPKAPASMNSRIRKEITRLNKIFLTKSDKEKQYLEGLIKRAAFMRCQLEDMEKDLDKKGLTEMFTQSASAPPYERERPVARLYNTLNKNYQTIMKQLSEFIDRSVPNTNSEEDDDFNDFLRS